MTKNPILLAASLFGAMVLIQGCRAASTPAQSSPGLRAAIPSAAPTARQAPVTHAPSPLPEPTATPLPTPTLPALPTSTSAPFLPAGLVPISPQNASHLKPVAALSEGGAGVVAFSPDENRVAAGLFRTNQVKVWNLSSGQELLTLGGHVDPRIISYLAFSPDGARLASGAQGWDAPNDSLILWDAGTGRELQRFSGVLGALSPDWHLVAITRREQEQGAALVLSDLASGKELHALQAAGDIYGVSFSPDGRQVVAKMFNVFQDLFSFWSVDSGRLDRTLYDWLEFAYSPDGRFIAAVLKTGSDSDKGTLNIFDASTFKWIRSLAKGADALWYTCPAFSPDGQLLTASFGDHVILWDTRTWEALVSLPASGPTGFAFSTAGRVFATYSQSDRVRFWGVAGGE